MSDTNIYRLSEEEHEKIFEEKIKPYHLSGASPADSPVAVIFGGQPGAGKSTIIELAREELLHKGGAVVIAGDDYRKYHTPYNDLTSEGRQDAALLTNEDISKWVEKAMQYSQKMHYNIIMESTMRTPSNVTNMLGALHKAAYTIDVRVLAVNERFSWQRVLLRYEVDRAGAGPGRMVVPEVHAEAYTGMLKSLDKIEQGKLADRVVVYRPDATVLYENEVKGDSWRYSPGMKIVVEDERNRPWTMQEFSEYARGFDRLLGMLEAPGRGALPDEINTVKVLRQRAYQSLDLEASNTGKLNERLVYLQRDRIDDVIKEIKKLELAVDKAADSEKPNFQKLLDKALIRVAQDPDLSKKIGQREPDIGKRLESLKGLEIGQDIDR